jgi:hypothetical protein
MNEERGEKAAADSEDKEIETRAEKSPTTVILARTLS